MATGGALDREEVLRLHGSRAEVLAIADAMGLTVPREANRIKCPFDGCRDKGGEGSASVSVRETGGIARLKCFRCDHSGTVFDLVMARDACDFAQALHTLAGAAAVPRPAKEKPDLRLVPKEDDPDKLRPEAARAIWLSLAEHDELGERYLSARDLEFRDPAILRFTSPDCACREKLPGDGNRNAADQIKGYYAKKRRIAMATYDVLGRVRGAQVRLADEPRGPEPKTVSITGTVSRTAFFGRPQRICDSWLVVVTEGMADTLAALEWSAGDERVGGCVVGAAGKGNLSHIAEEIADKQLDVAGTIFVLFPQNDRPENKSRIEFRRLSQLLARLGASCVVVNTPAEHKDLADWRKKDPSVEWPPQDLKDALEFRPTEESAAVEPPGGLALPVRASFRVPFYAQNISTLCALLDDSVTREAIIGPGEFRMHARSREVFVGSRSLQPVDVTNIRVSIEMTQKTPEGRSLKFGGDDIRQALELVASRNQFAPVEDYLRGLEWDRTHRLDTGLARALGVEVGSLEALFLRKWCIEAVRRAINPGCKADAVLLLVGAGGIRKSTFFEVMAGDWFSDSPMTIGDKDGMLVCGQKWIIEWQELESVLRAGTAKAKGFITSRTDTFRPPYGKSTVTVPRSCVFVGTTNDKRCLEDDGAGLRRWWPVEVKGKIDIRWVEDNRDQLWAEALAAAMGDEIHYLEEEYEAAAADHVSHFEEQDDWADLILKFHNSDQGGRPEYTGPELLTSAIGKPGWQWTQRSDQRRIASACRSLKWKSTVAKPDGVRSVRVYRPGPPAGT